MSRRAFLQRNAQSVAALRKRIGALGTQRREATVSVMQSSAAFYKIVAGGDTCDQISNLKSFLQEEEAQCDNQRKHCLMSDVFASM